VQDESILKAAFFALSPLALSSSSLSKLRFCPEEVAAGDVDSNFFTSSVVGLTAGTVETEQIEMHKIHITTQLNPAPNTISVRQIGKTMLNNSA
jgi:hypothetical protein